MKSYYHTKVLTLYSLYGRKYYHTLHTYYHTRSTYKTQEVLFFFFFYKIEFLLYPNLSVYICKAPSWKLEPHPLSTMPYKHLYL